MHLKYILFLVVFMFSNGLVLVGQADYTTAINASKKTKEAYKKAYSYILQRDYKSAKKDLNKLLKKDPTFVNAYIQLGYISEVEGNLEDAKGFFNKVLELAPDYYPKAYMDLSRIGMKEETYGDVVTHLTKFLTYDKLHPNLVNTAKRRLGNAEFRPKALANPVPFEPKNLGEQINSDDREYFPSITLDDELVYTVQIGQGQQGQEDLYRSQCTEGVWEKRQPISDVNTSENEAAQSISADGKLLVFTVCNRREDYGSCDLYYSKKINGKWTKPRNIGAPINSKNWESQPSIAPNSDAIYFVRGGARGQGDKNIFVTKLQADGTWGTPQKVEELNTPYHESSPSLHPDGKTLYFSSDGHPGMGGLDLFVTRMQADGTWGTPVNLGYPINTKKQEEALAVNRKGNLAFLASDRLGGYGSMDLYSFELPEAARPSAVTYINGITLSAETNLPLTAAVEIVDLKTGKVVVQLQTPRNGTFIACLPVGQYALNAKKDGYLFFSANYDLTEEKSLNLAYPLEAKLQPIVYKGDHVTKKVIREPIVLENVFFATASAKLKSESKVELDKLKALLEKNESLHIQLNGHTDNVGKPEDNLRLSDARAKAVMDYLIRQGIEAKRLQAKGFGETKPIYSNDSVKGRAANRRTEFEVL
ncbi:MAG: Outer membrane lipoprotein omp16 precursor [uncultured Aureispira sp.]|uniref:Outer membrane lipoprotein omp16 n=1 Tax=uncultured Aureispira sp. TaxID=1331704 RepID=A0A6S6U711_9BACT|nr:MAG: Outer membrane lipoprotein omp16 precursor [uncultured Aureispira sp.]